ncbi:ESCRT-III subunit protein did4 [Tulasnella sp. UAMH 9824]|nr:ESCRT-III subunit protein did4 [Tulasnella sp. UAMH 9824]
MARKANGLGPLEEGLEEYERIREKRAIDRVVRDSTGLSIIVELRKGAGPATGLGSHVRFGVLGTSHQPPLPPAVSATMNIVETLFGRSVTPAERLRQNQRALAKAQRELDRERTKLETQEKKLIADIKKSAKAGQMPACKVMAKDLVRTRRYIQKFYQMRTQLQAVGLRIQTLRSNQQMAEAMRGATRAMASMNRGLNLPAIQRVLNDFEKESSMMDMKEEMMSDAVDDVMEDEGEDEEEESDKILQQVLDDIGVSLQQQLADAPSSIVTPTAVANQRQAVALGEGGGPTIPRPPSAGRGGGGGGLSEEDELQARLDNLRR